MSDKEEFVIFPVILKVLQENTDPKFIDISLEDVATLLTILFYEKVKDLENSSDWE